MGMIGNQPANNFLSVTKDTFSGNNSNTTFTLSKAATTNGVSVFVNNVRQDPGVAYNVTNNTTLDFGSGNPPSSGTNNIYVLHNNTPASVTSVDTSAILPSGLTVASLTSNGAISGASASFTGDITLLDSDKIIMGTGSDLKLYHDSFNSYIENHTGDLKVRSYAENKDIIFYGNDGGVDKEAGRFDMSASGKLTLNEGFGVESNGNVTLGNGVDLVFEGATANNHETTLYVVDPTADRTVLLPDASGTVALQNASIDMNGTELILDVDGDTSITADTDDQIDFKVGGTDRMTLASGGTLKTSNLTATTTSIANSAGTGSINTQGGDLVTGRAIFTGSNNTGNASYLFGMNSESTRWVLYDFVNNVYKLIVANGGNVGITNGAFRSSPNNAFHNGAGSSGAGITTGDFCEFNQNKNEFILMLKNNNASVNQSHGLYITHATNHFDSTSIYIQCTYASFNRFLVYSNGASYNASNTWGNISDERLKTDIVDAKSQWNDIKNIKVRNFKKYDTGDLVQLGVVAQEVEKVSPSLIDKVEPSVGDVEHNSVFGRLYTSDDLETKPTLYTESDDIPEDKKVGDEKEPALKKVGDVKQNEPVKAIKYSVLYMKAIKALQESMTRIETLEAKVKALEEA